MLTIKRINKEIQTKGWDAELIKGDGYFWVAGNDVPSTIPETSIYVDKINHLPLHLWIKYIEEILNYKKPL